MRGFTIAATALILTALLGFYGIHRFENPKTHYATYADVVQDDAIGRGWVPEFLPKSARNIVEQHAIDDARGYLSFEATLADITALKDFCEPVDYDSVKYLSRYPSWWPSELTGSNEVSANLEWYLCEDYGLLTSIDGLRHFYFFVN